MTTAPIWLLDVDGVVNAMHYPPESDYVSTQVDGGGRSFPILYRRPLVVRIGELHRSGVVEARWLTTWCDHAAQNLGPALCLPEFAVEGADLYATQARGWWKSDAARRVSSGEPQRPLIWTDDDLCDARETGELNWVADRHAATLLICPDWTVGLTDGEVDRIEEFARSQADA
ncbi:MAG: hypothetical protein ACR2FF_05180 [Mycobacteriales bacterium]